jgi:hypothetical protein
MTSILQKFTIAFVREFSLKNKLEINEGWCSLWAAGAWRLAGGVFCHVVSDHAWIKIDKKHYDADVLQGALNPHKLPEADAAIDPFKEEDGDMGYNMSLTEKDFWKDWGFRPSKKNFERLGAAIKSTTMNENKLLKLIF